ncbi:diacylglycerol kinase family protein [Weissella ceti]|uniref:Diacylglycerol kinase family protein n=1 Tax=Weissella ceti TaxID=759620 RepID=A0ABT3E2W1_9LACO|nr:diacylglycerol kinase family protein [Weissella ceti]MCW0952743.1 diacylglycerol kinase family protein [Weissella ceti]QVK12443.1 diacylglycerol kinase family protein [Weissella ceti]
MDWNANEHQTEKNTRFLQAFGHAWDGVKVVLERERNMRFHLLATILVVLGGLWLGIGRSDWIWITIAVFIVVVAEFTNTMVEAIVDLIVGETYEPLAKVAKDVAAGGVLVSAGTAMIIGSLIFLPYIFQLFGWK